MSEESHRFLQERSESTLRQQLIAQENEIALMSAELARYRQIEELQQRRHELNERWMREYGAPSAISAYWQFRLIDFMRKNHALRPQAEIFFSSMIFAAFGKEGLDLLNEIMDLQDKIVKLECGENVAE